MCTHVDAPPHLPLCINPKLRSLRTQNSNVRKRLFPLCRPYEWFLPASGFQSFCFWPARPEGQACHCKYEQTSRLKQIICGEFSVFCSKNPVRGRNIATKLPIPQCTGVVWRHLEQLWQIEKSRSRGVHLSTAGLC